MLKLALPTIFLVAAGYFALCGFLYVMQRNMLYYPTPESGDPRAQELRVESDGLSIKVWHIPPRDGDGDKALLYFGGNAEDTALNISQFTRLFTSHDIYLMNYRGYGGSEGSPTETGLFADALKLYDLVAHKHEQVDILGRSLGTGIAVYLAASRKPRRLGLITPFDSMTNLAAGYYPFFPVRLLLKDRYDSLSRAHKVTSDTLLLIAGRDDIIPHRRSMSLASALVNAQSETAVIETADHNTIGNYPLYEETLHAFFSR